MPASRSFETLERLGLGLLGLMLPLVFLKSAEDAYRLPQLIALTLAMLCMSANWTALPRMSLATGIAAVFFAWRLITHILAGIQFEWILEQGLYALLFFWAAAHLPDKSRASRFRAALLSGAAIAAAYAVAQGLGFDPFSGGRSEQGFGSRAYGTLGNPNFWGGYLVLVLPFAIELPALAALLLFSLALSQTRAAWLAFGAGIIAAFLKGPRIKAAVAALLFVLALLLTAFPNPLNPTHLKNFERLASSVSLNHEGATGRMQMAQITAAVALKHPLTGTGPGHFTSAYLNEQGRQMNVPGQPPIRYRYTHDAHNDWLQLAAESGLPALLLFMTLFFLALRQSWLQGLWRLVALLASFGVNALLHFPLAIIPSAVLIWMALGRASAPPTPAQAAPAWLRLGAVLWCLTGAFIFMKKLQASTLLNRGVSLALLSQAQPSDATLKASLRVNARDERAWMRLGLNADARGDLSAAENAFSQAQSTPEGLANLALARAKSGKLDAARQDCLKALALNPRSLEALGNLGKIEYLRGDTLAAEQAYLRGLGMHAHWPQGHFNLAAIYINAGRKKEARGHLEACLRLDPANAQAAKHLKMLQ